MPASLIYKIAFSFLKRTGAQLLRNLADQGIEPEEFFVMDTLELSQVLGTAKGNRFEKAERDEALRRAEKEMELIERHNIRPYFILDSDYPVRLSQIPDAPVILYQLGKTDLDSRHIINIVGTRKPTPYGVDFCKRLVSDLADYFPDMLVVSGLAFGIDATAHSAALSSNLPTAGVVAHGLNMIYPAVHRDLARSMIQSGGCLISEYPFGETPFRQRFLERNRIIAALSDVTIVVESDVKGGAMSTANTAFSYSRDVLALPGRISDRLSSGCNLLIRKQKAHLLSCAADVIEITGWKPLDLNIDVHQRNLFPELDGDPALIYETIRYSKDPMLPDQIHARTLIPMPRLMAALGEMEFDGILLRHPGNRYSIS
ncbi:MAG: DNA-processing protein DprA [Muribaculaceae bacterium]|nr:DNA-processing protein DprA [Muribaculaceae bacterium]